MNKRQRQLISKWHNVNKLYALNMKFCIEDTNNAINSYVEKNGLKDDDHVPASVVIPVYNYQDLIIAMKEQLILTPEMWEVGIDSHFYNLETDELLTIPFSLDLPSMTHAELMNGCDQKVYLVDEIKTRRQETWKGLQPEMISNWESHGIPDGFELIKSQVSITAHTRFINLYSYMRFERIKKTRIV